MNFPSGCRIVFNVPNPAVDALAFDDVLEARSGDSHNDTYYFIYNKEGEIIRALNFAHVLIISPLTTAGPSNALDSSKSA